MRRRSFIILAGGALSWPLAARSQQALPAIGYLSSFPASNSRFPSAFRDGLADVGLAVSKDVEIEYQWALPGQYDQLHAMARDLIGRGVRALFASPINAAIAAKESTKTVPVVFTIGSDPVDMGLVASLNRPGGNVTGATFYTSIVGSKRLDVLRELVPNIRSVAVLVNPNNPTTPMQVRDIQQAATALGLGCKTVNATSADEFGKALSSVAAEPSQALLVSADSVFTSNSERLAQLAAQHRVPAIYGTRDNVVAGGLISYGTDFAHSFRSAGSYVGRIVKGEKPSDLPVVQPTKFEMFINMKAAKALGLTIPPKFLFTADEVIE